MNADSKFFQLQIKLKIDLVSKYIAQIKILLW